MKALNREEIRKIEVSAPRAPRTVHKVLLEAADLIEQRGWTQGTFQGSDGRLCAHGAIHMAVFDKPDYFGEHDAPLVLAVWCRLRNYLLAKGVEPDLVRRGCMSWNDAPGRTKEEVVQAMRDAAVWGRAQIIELRPRPRSGSEIVSGKYGSASKCEAKAPSAIGGISLAA
jgi:hypothetical protein